MVDYLRRRIPGLICLSMFLAIAFTVQADEGGVPERSEIDDKYKWDLTDMYASDEAWEADFAYIESKLPELESFQGRISESGADLLEFFRLSEDVYLKIDNVYAYSHMSHDTDTRITEYIGMRDRSASLYSKFGAAESWFTPELVSIPDETIETWYRNVPGLEHYRQAIDAERRMRPYTLTAGEEKLLAMSGDMARATANANSALTNTDITFPTITDSEGNEIELSEARYRALMYDPDRDLRRKAALTLYETYGNYKNTSAALMSGNVNGEIFYARARGYESALQANLYPDNIDTMVYVQLIETVHRHLPALHKYMKIRKEALGLDELHGYDMRVSLSGEETEWPYEKAVETIISAMEPLGDEYVTAMTAGFNSSWTDVYEVKAKRSGAYSWGSYVSHPYMLLNYQNTLDDMFTLAHEMGHCMHTWFSAKHQSITYAEYTLFCAEVASTFDESLLIDYLLANETDPAKKLAYVVHFINTIRGTLIAQVEFAEFELEMHRMAERGEALTADALSDLYTRISEQYNGPHFTWDEPYKYLWTRIPHFYRNFYVYKYATSISAALALAERVTNGGEAELNAYLGFLKGGSSKYSLDLLRDAGVDLTSPEPVDAAMRKFADLVDELEVLVQETKG